MPSSKAASDTNADPARAQQLFLDNQLCFALYATSLAMTKVYRPLLARLGLTYPQYVVMMALWQQGELSMGQLGKQVALDSGTLAPLVRKLVGLGLITRQRSAGDDRSVLVGLSASGHTLREAAHQVHETVRCATHCSTEQITRLTEQLQTLRKVLLDVDGPALTDAAPRP